MKRSIDNLVNFITEQHDFYNQNLASKDQEWGNNEWFGNGENWLSIRGNTNNINLAEIKRLTGFEKTSITEPVFIDFIKAVLVFRYRKLKVSPQALAALVYSLKRIYSVMRREAPSLNLHPNQITTEVLDLVDANLVDTGYKNVFDAAVSLTVIQQILNEFQLTISPLLYENKHTAIGRYNKIKKQSINLKESIVDDLAYEGDEKLITLEAFKAYAWITNNPSNIHELFGCRIIDILFATGMRINEVLYLPRDCWVERDVLSEITNTSLTNHDGDNMKAYGLKYFSEKDSEARILWLEPNAVPLAKRAIEDLKILTEEFHIQAEYLTAMSGERIISPEIFDETEIDLIQIHEKIFQTNRTYKWLANKKNRRSLLVILKESIENWCNINNVKPVRYKEIQVKYSRVQNKFIPDLGSSYSTSIPIYLTKDLDQALKRNFNNPESFLKFTFKYQDGIKDIHLKDMLILAPMGMLNLNNAVRLLPVVEPITIVSVSSFLTGTKSQRSIFELHGFFEEDGSKIKITTHLPRHNINTFLALAGMAEHQQALAMGRKDITQNSHYQHIPLEHHYDSQKRLKDQMALSEKNESTAPVDSNYSELILDPLEYLIHHNTPLKINPELTTEENLQRSFHTVNSTAQAKNLNLKLCDENLLLGELSNTYNEIKESKGLDTAQNFINTHGGFMHIIPNGACTRNIALHSCHKRLKCLSGDGCKHLHVTGRIGELENLQFTYDNMWQNLKSLISTYGNDPLYEKAINEQKLDIEKMSIVISQAKIAFQKEEAQIVFDESNVTYEARKRPTMLVDLFRNAIDNQDS